MKKTMKKARSKGEDLFWLKMSVALGAAFGLLLGFSLSQI